MKDKIIGFAAVILLIIVIVFGSCTSDPIVINVPGPPVNVGTMDTVIKIVETDVCAPGTISFEYQIKPLIVASCAYSGCHDLKSKQHNVVLETYSQMKSEKSKIIKTITESPNDKDFMPPKPAKGLTASQIQLIKDWSNQGASETKCKPDCNSENFSFKDNIQPIINLACVGCHQSSNAFGSINLEDYDHIRAFASNGQLLGCIKHDSGYDAMPPLNQKLTDCQIATIENWIVDGVKNN